MPQYLRFNLFPLAVDVNNEQGHLINSYPNTRAIVTDEAVFVYTDGVNGPETSFTDRLEDFSGNATDGWTVNTTDGYTLSIKRSDGCGCGSRLKGYNPFPGVPFERMLS